MCTHLAGLDREGWWTVPRVVLEGGGERLEDLGGQTSSWHRSGQRGALAGRFDLPTRVY